MEKEHTKRTVPPLLPHQPSGPAEKDPLVAPRLRKEHRRISEATREENLQILNIVRSSTSSSFLPFTSPLPPSHYSPTSSGTPFVPMSPSPSLSLITSAKSSHSTSSLLTPTFVSAADMNQCCTPLTTPGTLRLSPPLRTGTSLLMTPLLITKHGCKCFAGAMG